MPMMLIHDCNNMVTFKWSPMHRASIWRPAPLFCVLDPHIWGKNMVNILQYYNMNLTSGLDM